VKILRGIGAFVFGAGVSCALVFGVTLPATAASIQYFYGSSIENQTHISGYNTLRGGSVELVPSAPIMTVKATVMGLATYDGNGSTWYSHGPIYTRVYCKWQYDAGTASDILTLRCKYTT
jgi:hypothetical protein